MSVTLRMMRSDDIPAAVAIEAVSFATPWTSEMFADELGRSNRAWIVAELDAEVVGFAGAWINGEEAHLMDLAVAPPQRGRGVGALLSRRLMRVMALRGARRVTLEVRHSNDAARHLYESLGMEVVGKRPHYYPDTAEDALIMWGDLPAEPLILAIETSCDETAAAIGHGARDVVGSVVASQIDFHARFGGVVPEIASRKHTEAIVGVVDEAMALAGSELGFDRPLAFSELDAVAVTHGPGLVGALVVGLAYAKALAYGAGLPLVGVNHLEGHIFANVLADESVQPPLVALVVSGGHTSLVHMPEWGVYQTLGETLDDAAGEAFDKVAKVLGLGYPGGPVLSRLAEEGDPAAIDFPRAMMRSGDYAFSLSGLKTAVINYIRDANQRGAELNVPDVAASFQAAVIDVQVAKAVRAVQETGVRTFCLAGGVAANRKLRESLRDAMAGIGVKVSVPPLSTCTDNAAMIAAAAHYRFRRGDFIGLDAEPNPGLRLDA